MAEAILVHNNDGRPVLDVDPIELPRITVYGNPDHTDETNPDLHRFLAIFNMVNMPSALRLVWSVDRAPVMVHCFTCNETAQAWFTFVLDADGDPELICSRCDEDGIL